jgi:hypothetical protein
MPITATEAREIRQAERQAEAIVRRLREPTPTTAELELPVRPTPAMPQLLPTDKPAPVPATQLPYGSPVELDTAAAPTAVPNQVSAEMPNFLPLLLGIGAMLLLGG